MSFDHEALRYFSREVPPRYFQRIDGVACFSPLSDYIFWKWRLNRLVRRGVLKSKPTSSIWPSCNGMPAYALAY